jgi:hypothetical protein
MCAPLGAVSFTTGSSDRQAPRSPEPVRPDRSSFAGHGPAGYGDGPWSGVLGSRHFGVPGHPFQTRRDIHGIADDGEVHPIVRADVPVGGLPPCRHESRSPHGPMVWRKALRTAHQRSEEMYSSSRWWMSRPKPCRVTQVGGSARGALRAAPAFDCESMQEKPPPATQQWEE